MKTQTIKSLLVAAVLFAVASCGGASGGVTNSAGLGDSLDQSAEVFGINAGDYSQEICGDTSIEMLAGQTIPVGSLTVANTEEEFVITYSLTGGWLIKEAHLHVGCSLADIPQTNKGNPIPGQFAYKATLDPMIAEYTFVIPFSELTCEITCGETSLIVAAHASVVLIDEEGNEIQGETAWGNGNGFPGKNWATYAEVVPACCEDKPEECAEVGEFRTQTQGGWGTECKGNNPGCYRDDNFASCIGALVAGGNPYSLTLTSSFAVEEFLPQGGTPAALVESVIDPLDTEAGVLGGQVTALKLSVMFDNCDADFGSSQVALADLVAQEGLCEGMTVAEILSAGECVLSGASDCGFTASEINSCLSSSNEAFIDGEIVSGYLCYAE